MAAATVPTPEGTVRIYVNEEAFEEYPMNLDVARVIFKYQDMTPEQFWLKIQARNERNKYFTERVSHYFRRFVEDPVDFNSRETAFGFHDWRAGQETIDNQFIFEIRKANLHHKVEFVMIGMYHTMMWRRKWQDANKKPRERTLRDMLVYPN